MAAEVAAISLSTKSPSSSCLMSRPLGRRSYEQHHERWDHPQTFSLSSRGRPVNLTWQKVRGPRHLTLLQARVGACLEFSLPHELCNPMLLPPLCSLRTYLLPKGHLHWPPQGHSVVAAQTLTSPKVALIEFAAWEVLQKHLQIGMMSSNQTICLTLFNFASRAIIWGSYYYCPTDGKPWLRKVKCLDHSNC